MLVTSTWLLSQVLLGFTGMGMRYGPHLSHILHRYLPSLLVWPTICALYGISPFLNVFIVVHYEGLGTKRLYGTYIFTCLAHKHINTHTLEEREPHEIPFTNKNTWVQIIYVSNLHDHHSKYDNLV
jgi:hypothetical protein